MDNDRRSNVSSFYGSKPRPSFDPYENQTSSPAAQQDPSRARKDSNTSSFFNPRNSQFIPDGEVSPNYNSRSFATGRVAPVKGGKDEEPDEEAGWDVYADFNNVGPRYASFNNPTNDNAYRPIGRPIKPDPETVDPNSPMVELVTVPALGAEWKADELRAMTKKGKREAKTEARTRKWKDWNRDNTGFFGGRITRKRVVWGIFITIGIVGLVLAFTIPRVPSFGFIGDAPFQPVPGVNATFSRLPPANFTFQSTVMLEVGTFDNFLPLTITHIDAEAYSIGALKKVGTGGISGVTLPAKKYSPLNLTIDFSYEAINDTDVTWQEYYNACRNRNQYPGGVRPGLNIKLLLRLNILGLVTQPLSSASLNTIPCPYELSRDSS